MMSAQRGRGARRLADASRLLDTPERRGSGIAPAGVVLLEGASRARIARTQALES